MDWYIQVYETFPEHPKTYALAEALGIPDTQAVGILIRLWTWAMRDAISGDVSAYPAYAIASACHWGKKPDAFVSALISTGWIDSDRRLHNWDRYAGELIERVELNKAHARDRQRKRREKLNASRVTSRESHADVTRDKKQCHAPNPNPNLNPYLNHRKTNDDDDDARACEDHSVDPNKTIEEPSDPFDPAPRSPEEAAVRRVLLEFLPCALPPPNDHIADEIEDMIVQADYGHTPDIRADVIIRAMKAIGEAPREKHSWGNVKGLIRHWQKNGEGGAKTNGKPDGTHDAGYGDPKYGTWL